MEIERVLLNSKRQIHLPINSGLMIYVPYWN